MRDATLHSNLPNRTKRMKSQEIKVKGRFQQERPRGIGGNVGEPNNRDGERKRTTSRQQEREWGQRTAEKDLGQSEHDKMTR